jgi:hypothetical protein
VPSELALIENIAIKSVGGLNPVNLGLAGSFV